ncbi:hypothetical protein AAZX31_20G077700 [Glycine max]
MKIEDVEDKELVFANDVVTKMCLNYPLCLVGRINFLRIRVLMDVNMPFKRKKKIRREGGNAMIANFKYERLRLLCYFCGLLGHIEFLW